MWLENVVYFDGARWRGPLVAPNTDNLLDSRPAMLSLEPGALLMVAACDHRQSQPPGWRSGNWINNDLCAVVLRVPREQQAAQLTPLPEEKPGPRPEEAEAEVAQIAAMRDYRVSRAGQDYRLPRMAADSPPAPDPYPPSPAMTYH